MYLRSTIGKWKKKIAGVCEEPEETTLREKKKKIITGFLGMGQALQKRGLPVIK